jgi:hypothetical protein
MPWEQPMAGVVRPVRISNHPALASASAAPPYPRRGVLAGHLLLMSLCVAKHAVCGSCISTASSRHLQIPHFSFHKGSFRCGPSTVADPSSTSILLKRANHAERSDSLGRPPALSELRGNNRIVRMAGRRPEKDGNPVLRQGCHLSDGGSEFRVYSSWYTASKVSARAVGPPPGVL